MIGDTILSGPKAPISIGNALPLSGFELLINVIGSNRLGLQQNL